MDKSIEKRVEALWRQLTTEKPPSDTGTPAAQPKPKPTARRQTRIQPLANTTEEKPVSPESQVGSPKKDVVVSNDDAKQLTTIRDEMVAELERLRELREKLEADFDGIIVEVKKQAQGIVAQARKSAQEEVTEIRREALSEIKIVMARIENLQKVVTEEMRTQKALNDVAILQADVESLMPEDIQRHLDSMPEDVKNHLNSLMDSGLTE